MFMTDRLTDRHTGRLTDTRNQDDKNVQILCTAHDHHQDLYSAYLKVIKISQN